MKEEKNKLVYDLLAYAAMITKSCQLYADGEVLIGDVERVVNNNIKQISLIIQTLKTDSSNVKTN